jgi:transcriptional regulator of nitric oxide reductase
MIHPLAKFVGTAGLVMLCLISKVSAGMMPKDELEKLFEDQYIVGEIQSDLPVYPLFVKDAASPDSKPELKAYVFETNEVVSVRGYSGKPLNILVVIDLSGRLLSAKLIDHKEPIFVDS